MNLPRPPEWDMISSNYVFLLNPKETVTILLKFQTFRNKNVDNNEEFTPNQLFIMERKIRVVCNFLNGRITQAIVLNIKQ